MNIICTDLNGVGEFSINISKSRGKLINSINFQNFLNGFFEDLVNNKLLNENLSDQGLSGAKPPTPENFFDFPEIFH